MHSFLAVSVQLCFVYIHSVSLSSFYFDVHRFSVIPSHSNNFLYNSIHSYTFQASILQNSQIRLLFSFLTCSHSLLCFVLAFSFLFVFSSHFCSFMLFFCSLHIPFSIERITTKSTLIQSLFFFLSFWLIRWLPL